MRMVFLIRQLGMEMDLILQVSQMTNYEEMKGIVIIFYR